jgi:ribosomal protein S18 acetylase RimI-like enzyme
MPYLALSWAMDLLLRPARPDERDLFFATRRDGFRTYAEQAFGPWDDVLHRHDADRDFAVLPVEIIEHAGAVVGYQVVLRHADHWALDEIALVASARNRGLGTALIAALTTAAHAHGVPVRLSVLQVNPAQRLYARIGFRVTSVEPPRVKMAWP